MTCLYSPDQSAELKREQKEARSKADELVLSLVEHRYCSDKGYEHGVHGLSRRIRNIGRCIDNVYRLLPPDQIEIPDRETLKDVEINIQAAVFHVYGALDNLAFIWASERGVIGRNNRPLRNEQVGLSPEKREIWKSLPAVLQGELLAMIEWRRNLESFRHALGHRIPLYIPPFLVDPRKVDEYRELERGSAEALRAHRFEEHEELQTAYRAMRHFKPMMLHSLADPTPIYFHVQMLADFNTIHHLSALIFDELVDTAAPIPRTP